MCAMGIKAFVENLSNLLFGRRDGGKERTGKAESVQPRVLIHAVAEAARVQGRDFGDYISLPNHYVVSVSRAEWDRFYEKDQQEVHARIVDVIQGIAQASEAAKGASTDSRRYRIGGDGKVSIMLRGDDSTGTFDIKAEFDGGCAPTGDMRPATEQGGTVRSRVQGGDASVSEDLLTELTPREERSSYEHDTWAPDQVSEAIKIASKVGKKAPKAPKGAVHATSVSHVPSGDVNLTPVSVPARATIADANGKTYQVSNGETIGVLRRVNDERASVELPLADESNVEGTYLFSQIQCALVLSQGQWLVEELGRNALKVVDSDGVVSILAERHARASLTPGCKVGVISGDDIEGDVVAFTFVKGSGVTQPVAADDSVTPARMPSN